MKEPERIWRNRAGLPVLRGPEVVMTKQDGHLTGLLSEAEGEVNAASAPSSGLEILAAGVMSLLPPGASGIAGQLANDIVKQREKHRDAAFRRLIAAIASVPDDVQRRLEADPTFAAFVERVSDDAVSSAQAAKLEFYGRLLERSAPPNGPDEDERLRLLDTLNTLADRHLRLFHAIATTEAPVASRSEGGIDLVGAELDRTALERASLIQSGEWLSSANLRLSLTEFGLRFERFVAGDLKRRSPRWLVELGGPAERLAEVADLFAVVEGGPRIVREAGGIYLTHHAFEAFRAPRKVRGFAEEFLARLRIAAALEGRESLLGIGDVVECATGKRTPPSPLARGPEGIDPRDPPAIELVVESLASDPVVSRAIRLLDEASWPSLVECVGLIEGDIGPLSDVYGEDFSESDMIRFDSAAIAQGLNRPPNNQVAAMSLEQARVAMRGVMRSWLYRRAGGSKQAREGN